MKLGLLAFAAAFYGARATYIDPSVLDACPGYDATNVSTSGADLTANLVLRGPCGVFGDDVKTLRLEVSYETSTRIHLKITDPSSTRYEVPDSVFARPTPDATPPQNASIEFTYTSSPFSFSILRASTHESLFSTGAHPIIFAPQYLRVKTDLPAHANVYGLGEHTDTFRLPTLNFTRTLWSRDAYGVPNGTNLYGNHPVYFDHRTSGTHGVFFLNSNGMDIKLDEPEGSNTTTLEYNVVGGVIDMYFLAGSMTDPNEVARQYADLAGKPAEVPYWSLGLHQCRFGYESFVDVADVIVNYSKANIPLETMWTDIDYMYNRRVFTLDADYFPTSRMREIVDYLHAHDQQYVMMVDPAVAYLPNEADSAYARGSEKGVWLRYPNGSYYEGLVWPGVTVWPDWFNPDASPFWTAEFASFFNPSTGIDIDGAWIDMNEPSSFCVFPCTDPAQQAIEQNLPPQRTSSPPDPDTPIFGGTASATASSSKATTASASSASAVSSVSVSASSVPASSISTSATSASASSASVAASSAPRASASAISPREKKIGAAKREQQPISHDGEDMNTPPYQINNAAGVLSSKTADTDATHYNGLIEYDTHNLYGTMMSAATREAMLARRPGLRTLVITRSTFAGAGARVGKWLGDNFSTWWHYRASIAGLLGMTTVYQVPMVGSDICGYAENTTENLCARWAMLGAFSPFMRNHNADTSISQEFYRWPTVAQAARNALNIRYRLLDYLYTALHQASVDGTPVASPLWFAYPSDANTFGIDLQYLFGPSVLVSPVTEDDATSVSFYLPNDRFYDFATLAPVEGTGAQVTLENVNFTSIPLHIKGGSVLPLRVSGAMTTKALRATDFELVVAPGRNGRATGKLYADDGVSLTQNKTTQVDFAFANNVLSVKGSFGYPLGVNVRRVRVLGAKRPLGAELSIAGKGKNLKVTWDKTPQVLNVDVGIVFGQDFQIKLS
ncbi:alpha-glucosidase [Punctularia strigosozonata HHB-11173 SS5]|uniref:beta-glucosidase n=1 Tax=Punctularia strigosozonata (strain HHB-11173) TaxID=741275 RepID=R7S5E1_PUNST|nr:alpha-glucosidase [Punctularia strigosozonata HHB-11173 SS5]EIN04606.1 alpha-glucosidase [Punctularia strigosozonata HHB-11173 SS5]